MEITDNSARQALEKKSSKSQDNREDMDHWGHLKTSRGEKKQ